MALYQILVVNLLKHSLLCFGIFWSLLQLGWWWKVYNNFVIIITKLQVRAKIMWKCLIHHKINERDRASVHSCCSNVTCLTLKSSFFTETSLYNWINIWHLNHRLASKHQGSKTSWNRWTFLCAWVQLRKHVAKSALQQCLLSPHRAHWFHGLLPKQSLNEHSNHFAIRFNWKLMDWRDLICSGLRKHEVNNITGIWLVWTTD